MSKTKFPLTTRTAIWRANAKQCFFCGEAVRFRDLEIDHLIAETTAGSRVTELASLLDAGDEFGVNDFRNLVPTHAGCNARKSSSEFSEGTLRYFFEMWGRKVPAVHDLVASLKAQSRNETLLTSLASRIESGTITLQEVVGFLKQTTAGRAERTTEPVVISFGILLERLDGVAMPAGAPTEFPALYDWLAADLIARIRREIPSLCLMTEDDRNGETQSVRIAFWNVEIERVDAVDIAPWELLDVAHFSDLYETDWDDFFPRAVVSSYQEVIRGGDPDGVFGISRCPRCGGESLQYSTATDFAHDEAYHLVTCLRCRWADWSQ